MRLLVGLCGAALCLTQGRLPAAPGPRAPLRAPVPNVPMLLDRAQRAGQGGDTNGALRLATQAVTLAPVSAPAWLVRGQALAACGDSARALAHFDRALELQPGFPEAHYHRGTERLRTGAVAGALEDFDRALELVPAQAPFCWQRGIALCELGKFDAARAQFERHRAVATNDVETAVWHFFATARSQGFAVARAGLLPVEGDLRVPMRQIHDLFAGRATEGDVTVAAQAGDPKPEERKQRRFFADFYLGLYREAQGDLEAAMPRLEQAVAAASAGGYLGAVAKVHLERLRARAEPSPDRGPGKPDEPPRTPSLER